MLTRSLRSLRSDGLAGSAGYVTGQTIVVEGGSVQREALLRAVSEGTAPECPV